MKIIYSHLVKVFLPDLKKSAHQVAQDLTMIGHFADGFEKKEGEEIISLEVRQNRGDCLGYLGIAKELSVFYQIPLIIPKIQHLKTTDKQLPIKIKAPHLTKRVMAVKISNIKVKQSPFWLKKILKLHDINSINNVVDLTNYIMLLYGIPCHAFDSQITTDNLIWEETANKTFTTFDGTKINLEKDAFVVSNSEKVLSLAGIIGGKDSGITEKTREIIVEMAIYDRVKVRNDSRKFKIITEASTRLDKDLDPELIPQAFSHLVKLIIEHSGGNLDSAIYDCYLEKPKKTKIIFDPQKPSQFAGIQIKPSFAIKILKDLGAQVQPMKNNLYLVTPPSMRKDLTVEEDLIEEVIRFKGYDKIPTNEPISKKPLPNITPKILFLIEAIRNQLANQGYDEIRSWPLISENDKLEKKIKKINPKAKFIYTQNNINSDFPVLRSSIISSLVRQKKQYEKFFIPATKFFEIGKVFYKLNKFVSDEINNQYRENYCLGIHNSSEKELKKDILDLFNKLNYKTKIKITKIDGNPFWETNLDALVKKLPVIPKINLEKEPVPQSVIEIKKQIISLDANVFTKKRINPRQLIKRYTKIIGEKYLWQLTITDIYEDKKNQQYKYTLRASYFNLRKKEARRIHFQAFKLS